MTQKIKHNEKKSLIVFFLVVVLIFSIGFQGCSLKKVTKKQSIDDFKKQIDSKINNTKKVVEYNPNSKYALFIIAQKNFRDEELTITKRILESNDINTDVASITTDTAIGMKGLKIKPDLSVDDVDVSNYEAIIIVGGSGSLTLSRNLNILDIIKSAETQDKVIGAICLGPVTLAKADIIDNKHTTVFKTSESLKALKNSGAIYEDKDLVVDGKIITANNYDVAEKFGNELVKQINSK